jgi:hypothetical protein
MQAPLRDHPSVVVLYPGKLWSLWDMLDRLFGPLYWLLRTLESETELIKTAATNSQKIIEPEFVTDTLKASILDLRKELNSLGLDNSCRHIDRILSRIEIQVDYTYLYINLEDLQAGIRDEGSSDAIFHIKRERSKLLYDQPNPWEIVVKRFPSAEGDIISAIQCYMFDENTASVFHSMRIVEAGLAALSEALGLSFDTEVWHVIIDKIESEIRELERTWPKGVSKNEFLKFYSMSAKEFRYFKDGWRNYVSHRREIYDAPQALSTLNHVRDFMLHLSTRLSEVS